jgi:hypothetical protein
VPKLEDIASWPTVAAFTRSLGVSLNTGYTWVWTKKIDGVKVFGTWRVNPADVERIRRERVARAMGDGR